MFYMITPPPPYIILKIFAWGVVVEEFKITNQKGLAKSKLPICENKPGSRI
jgi:hypothetical protein